MHFSLTNCFLLLFCSFTWSDGKLNSSNLLLLSGQVVEHFDLEFRILYAQSKPLQPKQPPNCKHNSNPFDHLANKMSPCKDFTVGNLLKAEFARLSSTPKKLEREIELAKAVLGGRVSAKRPHLSGEEWSSSHEALTKPKVTVSQSTQTEPLEEKSTVRLFNCATQTSISVATAATQTTTRSRMAGTQTAVLCRSAMTQTCNSEPPKVVPDQKIPSKEGSPVSRKSTSTSSSARSLSSLSSQCSRASSTGSLTSLRSMDYTVNQRADYTVNQRADYFRNLHKEREFHYSVIRTKLNRMVSMLSRRGNVSENYIGCRPIRCNLKPRQQISTSLINLRDFALYNTNDCF